MNASVAVPTSNTPLLFWLQNLQGHLPPNHRHRGLRPGSMLQRLKPGISEEIARGYLTGQISIPTSVLNEVLHQLNQILRDVKLSLVTTAQFHRGEIGAVPEPTQKMPAASAESRPILSCGFTVHHPHATTRATPAPRTATAPRSPVVPKPTPAPRPAITAVAHTPRKAVKTSKPKKEPKPKLVRSLPVNPDRLEYTIRKAGLTFIEMAKKVKLCKTIVYYWLTSKTCHPDVPALLNVTPESLREALSPEQMQELETLRDPSTTTDKVLTQFTTGITPDPGLLAELTDLFRRIGDKKVKALLRARKALQKAELTTLLTGRDREFAAALLLG